ncbi:MAG: hypothetical protein HQ567_22410 [Candidatus Nealsonbacteria bacterium]|nr:hypothetical protein [Candidatus Nealsonbacteria bacterium]
MRLKTRRLSKAPKTWPCPVCGKRGRRYAFRERQAVDAELGRPAVVKVRVGLYAARCECQKVFESFHPELPKGWKFSLRVRELAVSGVVRDKLSVEGVRERLREEFVVQVSEGCVHKWLAEAGGKNQS